MKKYKTEWNLGLLYKSNTDPQIEKDLVEIEKSCDDLEKRYKNKDFTDPSENLLTAIKYYEKLSEKTDAFNPWWYFALKTDLNSEDKKASALSTKYSQRITKASNKIKFFKLEIAKIPKNKQGEILEDPKFSEYKYMLFKIFKRSEFNLPEGEEQLSSLLSQTSYDMWTEMNQKILTKQTIIHKGKATPISKALAMITDLPKKERDKLRAKINESLKSISDSAESEINAVYNFKKVMDERRGYKNPYSATVLSYENDEKNIELLVSLVTKYFNIPQRFYKLHSKLLNQKNLSNGDRNVGIGKIKQKFDFETSIKMLREVLENIDPEFANILDTFINEGHIDVYPKKGKKGGAYCWGMGSLPTFVLLNHNDNVESLETFAHEMGHAIHTELSKKQPSRYKKYSTSTAEVASTFFEQAMIDTIKEKLPEKEKIILLHGQIIRDINTIFRQIACFNFEFELHNVIRKEGQISKENLAQLMNKHMKSYTGNIVKWEPDDGYSFVSWHHIRSFFYVYSYAYGQIISKALYANYKKDPTYANKIKEFLKAGRSMSPEDIFKSIGIDTSKPEFFEAGLKAIEEDIKTLERLTKKQN